MDATEGTNHGSKGFIYTFLAVILPISLISSAWLKFGLPGLISTGLCVLVLVLIARTSRKWAWGVGIVLVPASIIAGAAIHEISNARSETTGPWVQYQKSAQPIAPVEAQPAPKIVDPFDPATASSEDAAAAANRAVDEANRAVAKAQQAAQQADRSRQARPLSDESLRKFHDNPGWISGSRDEARAPERHETVILHRAQQQDTDLPAWGNSTDPAKTVDSSK